jgi:hypothetical protein
MNTPPENASAALAKRRRDDDLPDRARYGHGRVSQAPIKNNGAAPILADIDIENALLGSLVVGGRVLIDELGASAIDSNCFYHSSSCKIFGAIAELYDEGAPINRVTVTQRLEEQGNLESVRGIIGLLGLDGNGSADVARFYLDELHELRVKREERRIYQRALTGDLTREDVRAKIDQISDGASSKSQFTVRSGAEILELKLDEHDCLFGDRLLSKGGKLVIAGGAGIGKSRLLLQFAAASITGRDFLGIETHAKNPRWLILQTENSNRRLQYDLNALKREFGESFLESLFIHTVESDLDGFVALDDESAVRRIEAVIRKVQPDIIGVDPLRDFGIGDLNTDADMTATVTALGRICRSGNPLRAIVAVHHALTGRAGALKATGYERSGFARNSKALLGWTRAQINVAPGSPDNNDTLVIACGKNNDGKEFPSFAVQLNPDTMIYQPVDDFNIDSWREHVVTGKATRKFNADMLRDLKFRELEIKPLAKLIRDQTGCGRSRAYELVREAKAKKILRFNKVTEMYAKI